MTEHTRRDERGAVAIMVAVLATVLFLVAALVVDLGLARDTKRQSQNAADASALAAGNVLYTSTGTVQFATAVTAAKTYALENFGVPLTSWSTCTDADKLAFVPASSTPCVSFDSATKPTLVRVRIPTRDVQTGLGNLAGVEQISISTAARVQLSPPGLPCLVCVLGSGLTHDLQNGDVLVQDGNVHFNGNVSVGTNGLVVTNGNTTVEGTASGSLANYTPDPTTGVAPITDPLSFITLPPAAMSTLTVKSNPCNDGPGKYGTYNFPNSTCTLQPGLYVIAGGSSTAWNQSGNSNSILAGTGVTLYFTCGTPAAPVACTTGQQGAWFDATGSGSITISAPTSGPLQGVAIAYDRNNTSTLRLTGNGISGMSGAIYQRSGKLQMNGNGCTAANAAIVVNTIEMNGNPACLSVKNGSNNPVPPPTDLHLDQ